MSETITMAAILDRFGLPVFLPAPARHHDVIRWLVDRGDPTPITGKQGFMTSANRFVDRVEACRIARDAEQIRTKHGPDNQLFSEDLW
jgi:hypothetical protein